VIAAFTVTVDKAEVDGKQFDQVSIAKLVTIE
jgi:hypothetical protein